MAAVTLVVTTGCVAVPAPANEPAGAIAVRPTERPARAGEQGDPLAPGGAFAPLAPTDIDANAAAYASLAADLAERSTLAPFSGPLSNWPVTGTVTSPFGPRWGGFHTGLDIAVARFTPVRAAAAGQVIIAGRPYLAFGDTAVIVSVAHGSNFTTMYVHLDDSAPPPVTVGQRVSAGTVVGYVGLTGFTTGPHVHFMTVAEGRMVDPRGYLP
jgi:murein DD-endopeptidase MepM/ murein hydrolase activator NlpD